MNMFEHDHSAARGKMATRKLFIFKHESELGNAPAHQLFDLIKVTKKDETNISRSYSDYEVFAEKAHLPAGVSMIEKI
jgi:CRISPR-associated protein Csd2